jgi:hypothetical protein
MNTMIDQGAIAPEVQEFLAAVRAQLADLDPDEQREILDGLEADLTDLVAERGGEALGDPVAYARELRAAAGLEPEMGRVRERLHVPARIHALLDRFHRKWDSMVARTPGDAQDLLSALRPVWWVFRGWLAVETAALWLGDWSLTIVPGGGLPGAGAVLLGVALSIQLGRGRLWPADGWRRIAVLRVALLGLNCFALAMIPVVLNGLDHGHVAVHDSAFLAGFHGGFRSAAQQAPVTRRAGVYADGKWVSNIYPYDAKGRPLVGVQLFNQIGQPINVVSQAECTYTTPDTPGEDVRVYYPWTNGSVQTNNVFPLPSRVQSSSEPDPNAFSMADPPTVGQFPLERVPSVSSPGIRASNLKTTGGYTPGQRPDLPINGLDEGC